MSARDDGGPAFPNAADDFNCRWEGVSARDYFASQITIEDDASDFSEAIKVAAVGRDCPNYQTDPIGCLEWNAEWRAIWRYMQADAMLKARVA